LKTIEFTDQVYGEKVSDKLVGEVDHCIGQIKENPYMYPAFKGKAIRKGLVNRFVSMFYRVRPKKEEIVIMYFHDNRQDPLKIKV
jgi:hypothetical protein